MITEQPWIGQYQTEWQLRSADGRLPKWFRVVALAYGTHTANGHAPQAQGVIADMLGTVDTDTGVIMPDGNVARWIQAGVDRGFLATGSTARCLIVPGHTFRSAPGNPAQPCPWCHSRRRQRAKSLT